MKRIAAIISIAILFTLLTSLIAYKGYLQVVADIEGRFNTAQLVMARHIAHSIEGLAEGTKKEMMIASLIPSIQKGDRGCLTEMQEIYEGLRGDIKYLYRLDENGNVTHVVPEGRIREAEERGSDLKPLITAPVSYKGRPAGMIGAEIDLSSVVGQKTGTDMLLTSMNGYAWVIDDRGRFIFHPEEGFIGRDAFTVRKERSPHISFEEIERIMREKMMKGESGTAAYVSGWHRRQEGKIKKLIAYSPFRIGARHYSLALVTPASEVTSLTRENFRDTLLLIGIVILIGIICLLVILYIDRQRIKHLVKERELGKEIKDSEERYRTLIEEAFDGIFVQRGARIVFANQRLHHMLGYGDGELIGMDHWLVYHPEYQDITRERGKARMRGEEVISRYEVKLQRKDGSWFYGEINARAISFAGDPGVVVWLRDITESKRAEEALRESEEKYRTILENIEDGYYEVDIAGNHTFFNDSFLRILGYSKDEFTGINYRHYTAPEDVKKVYQIFNYVYRTGKPSKEYNWEVTRKDGTKIHWEVSISLIRDSEGQPIGFRGIVRDMTEKKRAEESLRESEEKYRTILETIEDGYFESDIRGNFTFFNDSLWRILGYPRDELMGMNTRQYMDEETAKELYKAFNTVYNTGIPTKGFGHEIIGKDGTKRYVESSGSLIKDAEGKRIGFRGIMRDITEREQAKAEIIYLKEYNEKIVAGIPSSLLVLDRNLNIKSVNRTYLETGGIKDEDVVGKNIKEVFPDQLLKDGRLLEALEEVMATRETRSLYEVKHASSDHPEKILNITVSGLRRAEEEEEEEEATLILVIEDVTERARLQEEIRKKNEELENFVYVVSHDLKSPIVSMQGFSSMLLNEYREKLGEEGGRYIERIRANASRMEVLISDLLALSRLGRVVGAFKDASSLEIINRVCNGLKSRMEENRIEVSITDDLPIIYCDADRIYQVFENLVVNAVKFTGGAEEPKIEIGYEEKGEFHQFYVRDNGIGIDPKYHRKIFEIFQRLKEVEDEEGTGIGLVIVERIVKNHGGKVWVESEKGAGATFYFTLQKMPS